MSDLFEGWDVTSAAVVYTASPIFDHLGVARSPQWPRKRQEHIAEHPVCECCGRRTNLNVHHVKPFHLFPALELMDENLVTLCEGGPINCHYLAGHCGAGWSAYSRSVPEQIRAVRSLIRVLKKGAA